jgi:hypothetical protein
MMNDAAFKAMSFERVVCKFVTAQDDPRLGPAHPDLSYDPLHFFRTACAGVDIGAAQARAQQVIAAEDISSR